MRCCQAAIWQLYPVNIPCSTRFECPDRVARRGMARQLFPIAAVNPSMLKDPDGCLRINDEN